MSESDSLTVQIVGMTGSRHVYFNMSPEEALNRFHENVNSGHILGTDAVDTIELSPDEDKLRTNGDVWRDMTSTPSDDYDE